MSIRAARGIWHIHGIWPVNAVAADIIQHGATATDSGSIMPLAADGMSA